MKNLSMKHATVTKFMAGYQYKGSSYSNPNDAVVKVELQLDSSILVQAVAYELHADKDVLKPETPLSFSLDEDTWGNVELLGGRSVYDRSYNLRIKFGREFYGWKVRGEVNPEELLDKLVADVEATLFGIDVALGALKPMIKAVELIEKSYKEVKNEIPF